MSRPRDTGHVPRVYLDQALTAGTEIELTDDRFHHLRNVLRLSADDALVLFNGDGFEYPARITRMERRSLTLACSAGHDPARESRLRVVLGQAVARGDRMDYAIAKAIELGVAAIQPVVTERSKVRMDDQRSRKRQGHWQRVAIAAAEQSGRTVVPPVSPPCPLDDWLQSAPGGQRLVLDPESEQALGSLPVPDDMNIALLAGPESGLTRTEITHANDAGFVSTGLGPRVLRTETAGVAGIAAMQALWGDFR